MKKKKNENIEVSEPPQEALEKIIKTEMKVAQEISAAKEKSEKTINSARDETSNLKDKIIEQARQEREKMLADGLTAANDKAKKDLEIADQNSENFFKTGEAFIDSAVSNVIDIILDRKDGSR